MNLHQVAGRHGSFMTQFVRPARSRFSTREAMLRANSRKAVHRRLVLPLDGHHWSRAFEVLHSRYARRGRTAEHFQAVIRDMVEHSQSTQERAAIVEALDRLREQAFAEEIPVSRSLWSTLVYAYCTLERPEEALEAFDQAQRRFTYSAATLQYMAELILPVVCRAGNYDAASHLFDTHFPKNGKHSQRDAAQIQQWLAEAAARAGAAPDKVAALMGASTASATESPTGVDSHRASPTHTVHSLFMAPAAEVAAAARSEVRREVGLDPAGRSMQRLNASAPPLPNNTSGATADVDALSRLSTAALRSLLRTSCTEADGDLQCARRCWDLLYGSWCDAQRGVGNGVPPRRSAPSAEEVHVMLNALARAGAWHDALELFSRAFVGCRAEVFFTDEASRDTEVPTSSNTAASLCFQIPEADKCPLRYGHLSLDALTLDLIFSALPHEEVAVTVAHAKPPVPGTARTAEVSLCLTRLDAPSAAVRLLDALLWTRDDVQLTDRMMVVVGGALIQLRQFERVGELLRRAPALDMHPSKRVDMQAAREAGQRAIRERLCALVYYLHACTTLAMRLKTVQDFPFLFPPELFKHLPPPEELQTYLRTMQNELTAQEEDTTDETRFAAVLRQKVPTSVRPSRHHYFPPHSSAALTESQEVAMQRDFVRLLAHKEDAFRGSHADADKDPRPIPKGLHDHASGWDFFGRGGEMVFSNHRRTPHLLSMRPKVMRSLADPYRSWSPKLNSSLAHKENVIKWNGKSSV